MENKTIKTNIKSLLFVFVLLIGVTLVTAQGVWKEAPTGSDPSGEKGTKVFKNIFGPITQGDENQEKSGQLVTSGIINNTGDFITYGNTYIGSGSYNTPAYLFGDTYFPKMVLAGNAENKLCMSPEGNVKACKDVSFKAVSPKYYTNTNVVSFPSAGIKGYVTYKIGQSQQCATVNKTDTNWGGQTISGTNTSKEVVFSNWGTFDLQIDCDGSIYTATIKIGGSIVPATTNSGTTGSNVNYTLNLGAARDAYIYAIGGGGSAATESGSCVTGYTGSATSIKIGSVTIANVNGGTGAVAGIVSGCTPKVGKGGSVIVNSLTSSYKNSGYDGSADLGGCNGKPDSNNNLNTCNSGGTVLPYGKGGSGYDANDDHGGGGGAYVSGNYTLPATGTLTTFVGSGGGKGGTTPKGQNGYIWIEW